MDLRIALITADAIVPYSRQDEGADAWQYLISTGHAWTLSDWHSKTAAALIGAGILEGR